MLRTESHARAQKRVVDTHTDTHTKTYLGDFTAEDHAKCFSECKHDAKAASRRRAWTATRSTWYVQRGANTQRLRSSRSCYYYRLVRTRLAMRGG